MKGTTEQPNNISLHLPNLQYPFPSYISNILSFLLNPAPPATDSTGTAIQALLPTLTRIMRTILAAATMRAVRVLMVPTVGFTVEDVVTGDVCNHGETARTFGL